MTVLTEIYGLEALQAEKWLSSSDKASWITGGGWTVICGVSRRSMGRIIVSLVDVYVSGRHPANCRSVVAMVFVTSLEICISDRKRLKAVPDDERVGNG